MTRPPPSLSAPFTTAADHSSWERCSKSTNTVAESISLAHLVALSPTSVSTRTEFTRLLFRIFLYRISTNHFFNIGRFLVHFKLSDHKKPTRLPVHSKEFGVIEFIFPSLRLDAGYEVRLRSIIDPASIIEWRHNGSSYLQ